MASSYFVRLRTGRSAGFSALGMRASSAVGNRQFQLRAGVAAVGSRDLSVPNGEEAMTGPKPFVIVRDNFYPQPDEIRRIAQSMKYRERSDIIGYMTDEVLHERGMRRRLEQILGVRITRWDDDDNGIFYG